MAFIFTAPQTAKIQLAKQWLIEVQYDRPDFVNGMKTVTVNDGFALLRV